jgi:3-oxoacyl-[acyl-carrier protein] reductase
LKFKGQTVVVTGGSRGIGRAIALSFAKEGANIVINYANSSAKAEAVVEEIKNLGVDAIAIQCDVSKDEDVSKMTEVIYEKFEKVDVLINNAGITRDGLLIRMKEKDFEDVLDINLKGTFLCTKHIGKKMLKKKSGKIVNITSVVGVMGNAGQANYAASKAGVIGFTKSVAKEFASRGINVNAIAPGFIETEMTADLKEDIMDAYTKAIPLGKMGKAEDVAKLAKFLSSDESSYITGQIINVDGGMVM